MESITGNEIGSVHFLGVTICTITMYINETPCVLINSGSNLRSSDCLVAERSFPRRRTENIPKRTTIRT